jgi:hypothetical protein
MLNNPFHRSDKVFKSIVAIAGLSLLSGGVALAQSTAPRQSSGQYSPPVIVRPAAPDIPQPRTSPCPAGTPAGTWCAGKAL